MTPVTYRARCRTCRREFQQPPQVEERCPTCGSLDVCAADTERPAMDRHDTDEFEAVTEEYLHTHDPTRKQET